MRMALLASVIAGLVGSTTVAASSDLPEIRSTPDEIAAKRGEGAGAGSSGVAGIQTTVLQGDPTKPGLYTIRIRVPANTVIAAHTHRDNRTATVTSGTWFFGYGSVTNEAATKALPPGSFYSEPAGVPHFAITKANPVVVYITGIGPTDTVYVDPKNDPRRK